MEIFIHSRFEVKEVNVINTRHGSELRVTLPEGPVDMLRPVHDALNQVFEDSCPNITNSSADDIHRIMATDIISGIFIETLGLDH